MKYVDEFRNSIDISNLSERIRNISRQPVSLMEICGGHTMSIQRFGIPSFLPDHINLVSGPGCPVCVTSTSFIDHIIALSRRKDIIITSYGDLLRIPGSTSTLEKERATGSDVRIVYSSLDALDIALSEKNKIIIFPAIGFETTSPATATAVIEADKKNITNFMILCSHKRMPEAMNAIVTGGVKLNGFICPGHVTAIAGIDMYRPIVEKYHLPCVISGFEPADIMLAILMLVQQIENDDAKIEIAYKRVVKPGGNPMALSIVDRVFTSCDDEWRGIGIIPDSGLTLRSEYSRFDASNIEVTVEETKEPKGCICGQILAGVKKPGNCTLFRKICTPENPVGACMVSSEGSCAAYYRYDRE